MKRLLWVFVGVVLLAAVAALVYRPLFNTLGSWLIVQDPIVKSDVIIVLSGGRGDERVRQGSELYHQGYAPLLLLSGGEEMVGISIPELQRRQALGYGVPASALLIEGRSTSTREQAVFLRSLLADRKMHRAIVVTSNFHTRRTRYIFHKVFAGSGINLRVYPVQHDVFRPQEWWTRDQDTEDLVLEYIKLGLAVFR